MRVRFRLNFLTFVITLTAICAPAHAKPEKAKVPTANPTSPPPPASTPPPAKPATELDEYNLMPTPPPEPLPEEAAKTYVYPYRQQLTPRAGYVGSNDDDDPYTYMFGILYLWPRYVSPQAEFGADLVNKYGGHLNFAVRTTFYERGYFRPFWLWGLTHEAVPEDKLATFVNLENYYLRIGIGFEDVIKLPKSVRLEIEGLAGTEKQMYKICLGYSWGF